MAPWGAAVNVDYVTLLRTYACAQKRSQ